jgi:hypothetical protein
VRAIVPGVLRSALRSFLAALRDRGFVVFIIALVTTLYGLGLVVPQRRMVPPATWEAWRGQSPRLVALLEGSGLADVYAAPGTYVALGFFFLSLAAVVVDRFPRLVRRTRVGEGIPLDAASLARRSGTVAVPAGEPEEGVRRAAALLRAAGWALHQDGARAIRGVRFRVAPLGFLLFHGAFALLLAGGVLLDLTRFSGIADVGEGEPFDTMHGEWATRPRAPRIGADRPDVTFTVAAVHPHSEGGFPVSLRVELLVRGVPAPRVANINEPVVVATSSILVRSAGAAPLFTCEAEGAADGAWVKLVPDAQGRTHFVLEPCGLDVLARPYAPDAPDTAAPGGQWVMLSSAGVARLEDVAEIGIEVAVRGPDGTVARGILKPGGSLATADGRRILRMPELRYYAKLQVVDERGGGLLWAGFLVGVLGLVLRLVLFRREVVVVADPAGARVLVATAADAAGWSPDTLVARVAAAAGSPQPTGEAARSPA